MPIQSYSFHVSTSLRDFALSFYRSKFETHLRISTAGKILIDTAFLPSEQDQPIVSITSGVRSGRWTSLQELRMSIQTQLLQLEPPRTLGLEIVPLSGHCLAKSLLFQLVEERKPKVPLRDHRTTPTSPSS